MGRSRAGNKRKGAGVTKKTSRFSSADPSFSLKAGVVHLSFPSAPGKPSLYSHAAVLSCWSNVLAGLLEGADPSGTVALDNGAAAGAAAGQQPGTSQELLIELQDEDITAWEEALGFMHPKVPLQQVTGDNAQRLLLLADKYDMSVLRGEYCRPLRSSMRMQACCMLLQLHVKGHVLRGSPGKALAQPAFPPCNPPPLDHASGVFAELSLAYMLEIWHTPDASAAVVVHAAEMVVSYLNQVVKGGESRLHADLLNEDTATKWLVTFSRCGLDELVEEVQDFIVSERVELDEQEATAVRQEHLVQMLNSMQGALAYADSRVKDADRRYDTAKTLTTALQDRNAALSKSLEECQAQLRARGQQYYHYQ